MNLDPRIGMLNSGKFYCFPKGHGQPEFIGTLEDVEAALCLRKQPAVPVAKAEKLKTWNVKLSFQYPAWDEVNGVAYPDIQARSKAEANSIARRRASDDGHLGGGKGRATFTATEQ